MSVAVGNLGAESDVGGQSGLGQGGAGQAGLGLSGLGQSAGAAVPFGKANWFKGAGGDLATSLSSASPSFRSTWQSMVEAWRGVSRGTNVVENEQEETPTTPEVTRTEEALTGTKTQIASLTSSAASSLRAASVDSTSTQSAISQAAVQAQLRRCYQQSDQDAARESMPTANGSAETGDRSGATSRRHAIQAKDDESVQQAANASSQVSAPATEATMWSSPVAAPIQPPAQAQTVPAETAQNTPSGVSTPAFSGLTSQTSEPVQLWTGQQAGDPTDTLTTAQTGGAGRAGNSARTTHMTAAAASRSSAQSPAARESAESAGDDAPAPAADLEIASAASAEALPAGAPRASWSGRIAAAGENSSSSSAMHPKAGSAAHPGLDAGSAASAATVSGTAQAGVDATQDAGKSTLEHAASRSSSHDADRETASTVTPVVSAPPAAIDGAAARAASAHGSTPSGSGHSQTAASTATTASSATDTFSALDRGSSVGTPAWTHAGGQHAEAGFEDPALGWVGVRADLSTGGIHATLVPSSADAAQTLSGHLAGLSSHLTEQQTSVASLSMASPGDGGIDSGTGQQMQQGAEGQAQGSSSGDAQSGRQAEASFAAGTPTRAVTAESSVPATLTSTGDLRGTRISVMA